MSTPSIHLNDVTASSGVPFRVVFYRRGAAGPYPAARSDTHELVEIYDRRFDFTAHGQFTGGRYHASTLLGTDGMASIAGPDGPAAG